MEIDQKYFVKTAYELDKNLNQVGVQHGTASPLYQLVDDLRKVVLTIIDDIVHPPAKKMSDGMNTAKAMETVDPYESVTTPYNNLAHAVFEFKKLKKECATLVSERDNLSIKVDLAVNKRNSAKKEMEAAFEKIYK